MVSKILSINSGSSSLKFKLYEMPEENVITKGMVDKIGHDDAVFEESFRDQKKKITKSIPNHEEAVHLVIDSLINNKIVADLNEIKGVGHRISNGGEKYEKSVIVDDDVEKTIDEYSVLSPLHNPVNLLGIKAFDKLLPNTPQVAVFDTAFNSTIPPENALYALPYEYYQKYGIKRFGFHGPSHLYITEQVQDLFPNADSKIISCHIGSGASISAIKDGKTIDNSMGFSPLAGLIMGTRSGDIDPQIIPFLQENEGLSTQQITDLLNKKSGLLGVSGVSNDLRDVEKAAKEGNKRAQMAIKAFVHRIQIYIGQYIAELDGVDTIVFTAGVGEHDASIRKAVMENFHYVGAEIDDGRNDTNEIVISSDESKVNVAVIPTDEEIVIARDVFRLV
ncbi:acetate/propionate family kinase [Companilactobacillus ginsenosidimutans]|uniref:Acetate kinase n=1 Tax=Companilactobacillus ginsenosidimutans TaxID=1007676 RepID=A0A0H4QGR0_9LACO|nr:acetate kinase [Companilactobacillus ginsenosidimutans]AKP66196.1 acetate kinase [Companilactobacillus ginsenosidimutans]